MWKKIWSGLLKIVSMTMAVIIVIAGLLMELVYFIVYSLRYGFYWLLWDTVSVCDERTQQRWDDILIDILFSDLKRHAKMSKLRFCNGEQVEESNEEES